MEDDYIKWRNLIGDFMLAFAEVEGELNNLLLDLSFNQYDENIKNQFKERQTRARSLLEEKVSDDQLVNRINKVLDQLLNLAENERNLIAHNPLQLSLDSIFEEDTYFEIRSRRKNDKFITYEKLEEKYIKLREHSSEFESACDSVSRLLHP